MARIKTKWNLDKGIRGFSETASVISTNIWRMITEALLDMENEGFQTVSNSQRMDVLSELAAYLIHLLDRELYQRGSQQTRQALVVHTAKHLSQIISDNRLDSDGVGDHQSDFLALLNRRSDQYAECSYNEEGAGFSMQRQLSDHIAQVMGAKNQQWVATYVLDIVAPDLYRSLLKTSSLLLNQQTADASPRGE